MERRKKGGSAVENCKERKERKERRWKSGISKLALPNLGARLEKEREKKTTHNMLSDNITKITYSLITASLYFIIYKVLSHPYCNLIPNVPQNRWDNYPYLMGD